MWGGGAWEELRGEVRGQRAGAGRHWLYGAEGEAAAEGQAGFCGFPSPWSIATITLQRTVPSTAAQSGSESAV